MYPCFKKVFIILSNQSINKYKIILIYSSHYMLVNALVCHTWVVYQLIILIFDFAPHRWNFHTLLHGASNRWHSYSEKHGSFCQTTDYSQCFGFGQVSSSGFHFSSIFIDSRDLSIHFFISYNVIYIYIYIYIFVFFSSIATGFRGGVFSVTFARLNIRLRNLLFRSLMRQEIGFFDANHTGNVIAPIIAYVILY